MTRRRPVSRAAAGLLCMAAMLIAGRGVSAHPTALTHVLITVNDSATLDVVFTTLALLLFVQRSPDMVMIGGVVVLLATGVLTPEETLKGMSNEGMITVAALFVVAAAVERYRRSHEIWTDLNARGLVSPVDTGLVSAADRDLANAQRVVMAADN